MPTCVSCGHENPDGARFCNSCGAALAELDTRREERKVVTVVFADLVGSTAAAERSDPEDVRAMLASHHARVRAELERFGGTVEKFIGDAVVAVFGAPAVREDDPERAVRAALAIRDVAREAAVELRVAVNTGEALVSLDARPSEGEGMVAGDVVNTAARIQSAAPVNGVLVGATTYRATSHVIEYREADAIAAKGKAGPVPVWEAIAPRSRFGSDVEEAPLAPLVGRQREVDALRDALTRARDQRETQLVTIVGVPGIGKSRLVAELFAIVDDDPDIITWRQGRCLPYGEGISFWALGEMAKAQAGVLESDTAADAEQKLADAVSALIADEPEARWVADHLRPLVGMGSSHQAGGELRGEAFAAWRTFLEALADQRPTVLVFEDLHWADDGLLDFVDGLVERATGVPLLVLCSARPELLARRPAWGGGKANAATLSLSPLTEEETARLISAHLAQAVLPAEMQRTLLARAEGNPLFAEEYIRMLRDRGLLRRDGDVWRLDDDRVDMPETVQGIIAARLDALRPEEKELLQAAAVVGKVFWLGSVATVAGVPEREAEEVLHRLERRELVRRDRRASVAGETEYAARHVLLRDVAYGQIPRARRAELHVRAAHWIEALAADRSEDRAEMLAHHYSAALELARASGASVDGLERPAATALREAGDRAWSLSAPGSAEAFYRRALELWPEDDPDYARLLLQLGRALAWTTNEGEPELRDAADRLRAAGAVEAAAEAEAALGETLWVAGRRDDAFAAYGRAVELIDGLPDTRATTSIRANFWRARVLANQQPSLEEGKRIVELAERHATRDELFNVRITFALGLAFDPEGDVRHAIAELERVLEETARANSYLVTRAYVNLASLLGTLGELTRCAALHREGLELTSRFASHHMRWLEAECVMDDFYAGAWDRAFAAAARFLGVESAAAYMDGAAHYVTAAIAAARGDLTAAAGAGERGMAHAREIGDPQVLWGTLGLAARLALERGDVDRAAAAVAELERELAAAQSFPVEVYELDGFLAAAALGRGEALGAHLGKASYASPWVDAAALVCAGELDSAADVLERHDAHAYAATARLLAAELAGRETPGLRAAIAFYERVGAAAYLDRAARVLQASA